MVYIMQSQNGTITSKELKSQYVMTTNHWQDFTMKKNISNKVNRWGLKLAAYNITLKWISDTQHKVANCLLWLVNLSQNRPPTVQMLSSTYLDGPAFNTRNRTSQCTTTEDHTSQPQSDAVTPDVIDTTYLHHHWSPHRMAWGLSHTRQIVRYHSIHIHQSLPSSPHVP